MAKSVDSEWVEKKLRSANDTMESVQTLSLWALKHKNQCEQIVAIWLKVLKSEAPSQMIVMFYLCNEVLQTCKKKNAQVYKESFKNVLKEAVSVVKDERAVFGLEKILSVWADRKVFEEQFIAELNDILTGGCQVSVVQPEIKIIESLKEGLDCEATFSKKDSLGLQVSDFSLASLCSLLRNDVKQKNKLMEEDVRCCKFLEEVDVVVNDVTQDTESQRMYLENNEDKINDLCKLHIGLNSYLDAKHELCQHLEIANTFYEGLLKDAKLVFSAYKNYNNRVKTLSKKLFDRHHLLLLSEQSKQDEEEEEEDDDEDGTNSMDKFKERSDASLNVNLFVPTDWRQRSTGREEFNVYKDVGKSQEKVEEDEEDKLFTHLFLEDPSEDDRLQQSSDASSTGSRRQSLDARLEMMGFPGNSVELKRQVSRRPSHEQIIYSNQAEQPKLELYESFNATHQFVSNQLTPLNSSNFQNLNQQPPLTIPQQQRLIPAQQQLPQQQLISSQQQMLFPPQLYVPQIGQHQVIETNEGDDGRETPVQDEPPSPVAEDRQSSKPSKFDRYMSGGGRGEMDELFHDFCKKSGSLKRRRRDEDKDISPRRAGHKEQEKRKRVKKDHHHHDDKRKSSTSKEKRRNDRDSRDYPKSSKSRHQSRGSSRESEKRVRNSSPFYLTSSKRQDISYCSSKARDSPPHKRKSFSRSPSLSPSSKPNYVRKLPESEIVMEGIYQAIERPDGYSEIYRLPSNVDPNNYTYEEVVYLFTEEDGAPQLKQMGHNVPPLSNDNMLHTSTLQYLPSNTSIVVSNSVLPTFSAMSNFKSPIMSTVSHIPARSQTLMPIDVIRGIGRTPVINTSLLGPARVQVPPPPLPRQPVYPFVQQPPPPLPSSILTQIPPVIAPPTLLTNQLKDSVPQSVSILGVPLANQIPSSASNFASSFSGISKNQLPSPSQFCQGIGATALLQRRLHENSLESKARVRSTQIQSGKLQVSSFRRAPTLTAIPLTDDISNESATSKQNIFSSLVSAEKVESMSTARKVTCEYRPECREIFNENVLHQMPPGIKNINNISQSSADLNTKSIFSQVQETGFISISNMSTKDLLTGSNCQTSGSTRIGDDCLSDNGSSDLEDFQDAVTFTSPLSLTGTSSTVSYTRGRDANIQSVLSKRSERNTNSSGSSNNMGRGLLPNVFIPQRLPLQIHANQFQQFRNNLSINFGQMPGLSLGLSNVPPFGVGIPLSMPMNRPNMKGNPRF